MGDEPPSEDQPTESVGAPAEPETAFDPAVHDIIVDLKALCSIPFDCDVSATETLRAFRFEKCKAMHGPVAGSYAVAGDYAVLDSLSLVHFNPSKKRKPELILSYADYGMASNGSMTGQYVCSLPLPLSKRKGQYETNVRYSSIADVVGFSQIKHGQAPWSIHLEPALKKLGGTHCTHKLFTPAELTKYVEKPLQEKIKQCHEEAKLSLASHLSGIRRQDANLAEKHGATFGAQLQKTVDWLNQLPPSSYDIPLAERIIKAVAEGVQACPDSWLTPAKAGSLLAAEVQANELQRTAKRTKRGLEAALEEAAAPAPAMESLPAAGDAEGVAQEAEDTSKRTRKQPEIFEFSGPTAPPKGRNKKVAEKAKLPELNPRTHLPWVRGPYKDKSKPGQLLATVASEQRIAGMPPPAPVSSTAERDTIAKLQAMVSELQAKLLKCEAELVHAKASVVLEVSNAKLEMQVRMQDFASSQYQKGLVDGASLSSGVIPSIPSIGRNMLSPCASESSSSQVSKSIP